MSTENFDQSYGCLRHRTAPQLLKRKTPSTIESPKDAHNNYEEIAQLSMLPNTYQPIKPMTKRISLARRCESVQPPSKVIRAATSSVQPHYTITNTSSPSSSSLITKIAMSMPLVNDLTTNIPTNMPLFDEWTTDHKSNEIEKKEPEKLLLKIVKPKKKIVSSQSLVAMKKKAKKSPFPPSTCVCRRHNGDDWIGCNAYDCPDEWFHFSCVGLRPKDVKRLERWYCIRCRIKRGEFE